MIILKRASTRLRSSNCGYPAKNTATIPNLVIGVVLVSFLVSSIFFAATVGADVSGTCERDPITGLCETENADCTIMVDGESKAGKCKSNAITTGGWCVCTPNDGTKVQETEGCAAGTGEIPPAPAEMTFTISVGDAETICLLPEEFGDTIILVTSISGSVTLQSQPSGDPNIDLIEVVSGTFQVPSIVLPNGDSTGQNTFVFVRPGSNQGTLNRTTGEFYFPAYGRLTNDLFPLWNPIRSLGDYFGTVDMATGEACFDTRTFDFIPGEPIPTLTQWGLIILVVLIVFSTWVILRRRKTVVS